MILMQYGVEMQKFRCYYDTVKFIYFKHLLDKNGFLYCGSPDRSMGKIATFNGDKYNIYIDCHDGDDGPLKDCVIKSANGKPFLYFRTAYCWPTAEQFKDANEQKGGTVEPFFKWCGANSSDGFYNQLYPIRKEIMQRDKATKKDFDIGFCCALSVHPVAELRKTYVDKFRTLFGNKFYYNDKLEYKEYINQSLRWKTSFNCRGCGEYTSRIIDACAIGKTSIISFNDYDNAISWKGYIPQVDFTKEGWEKDLCSIIDDSSAWGEKCLYYFEHFWTPDAIFNYMVSRIDKFESKLTK